MFRKGKGFLPQTTKWEGGTAGLQGQVLAAGLQGLTYTQLVISEPPILPSFHSCSSEVFTTGLLQYILHHGPLMPPQICF